jgi:hypothetical protein
MIRFICLIGLITILQSDARLQVYTDGVLRPTSNVEMSIIDTLTDDGVWTWFNDPRSYYSPENGEVVTGWINSLGQVKLKSYPSLDTSGVLRTIEVDDHDNPVIIRKSDGKYLVGYTTHDGDAWIRESTNTDDITSFETEVVFPSLRRTYSYLHEIESEGRMYTFFRDLQGGSLWGRFFQYSEDGGDTWSAQDTFLNNGIQRLYTISRKRDNSRIDFITTDGHPNNIITSIFHFYYQDDYFFRTNGDTISQLGTGFVPLDSMTLVYDADISGIDSWVWDLRFDEVGNPIVVYATIVSEFEHYYNYARWTNGEWIKSQVCAAGATIEPVGLEHHYSGGITILDRNTLICSREVLGDWSLFAYTTPDGGRTWLHRKIETGTGLTNKKIRPFVPINATWDSRINLVFLSGEYTGYTDYQTKVIAAKIYKNQQDY